MGYVDGFGVTLRKWVGVNTDTGRRVTTEYPEEVRPKPERFHGRHVLNRYEDGMEKCIGCELCAGVCPARCIYVRGQDNDPDDPTSPGERFGYVYEINYLRCIHCDLCVEACPTEAITETKMFEFAFTNRADGIYTKDELLVDDEGRPRQLPFENWDGGFDAARDTSGWMRSTAPNGDAGFVGIVAWAGELGYGVRAPERDTSLPLGGGVPDRDVEDDDHAGHDDHAGPAGSHDDGPLRTPGSFDLDGPADPSPARPTIDSSASEVPDTSASDVIRDLSRRAGQFDAGSDETVAQQASASPTAGPGEPADASEPDPATAEPAATDEPNEPKEPQPPARAPGMFDAADADEPEAKPSRWRRGKGDR